MRTNAIKKAKNNLWENIYSNALTNMVKLNIDKSK